MEKYPSIPNNKSITPIGPISGLEISFDNQDFFWCLSASFLCDVDVFIFQEY
jgi:hypothetical protein